MAVEKIEVYGVRHTYIEYNSSGTLAFKRVWMTNKTDIKVENTKLTFSGDGKKYTKNYGYMASGSIEADADDDTIDSILWATPVVLPQGGDDFAKRYVKGGSTEMQTNFVGIRISLDAADIDTGAPLVVRYRILKVAFNPDTPPAFETEKNAGRVLSWDGRWASVDVSGATPTGMPSGGCFWLKDLLNNTANFDPVPGDVL